MPTALLSCKLRYFSSLCEPCLISISGGRYDHFILISVECSKHTVNGLILRLRPPPNTTLGLCEIAYMLLVLKEPSPLA